MYVEFEVCEGVHWRSSITCSQGSERFDGILLSRTAVAVATCAMASVVLYHPILKSSLPLDLVLSAALVNEPQLTAQSLAMSCSRRSLWFRV